MRILLMALPSGSGRALSSYVRPDYGAFSPDGSRSVKLPTTLLLLWVALTDHPNQVIPYATLARALWPDAVVVDTDLVRAHVGRLRALLVQVGWPSACLEVVWGRGVVFHAPHAAL